MARVYSTRFFTHALLSGAVSYEVPAGFLAVLRDVIFASTGGDASTCVLIGPSAQQLLVASSSGSADEPAFTWSGRQVWNAGEVIGVEAFDPGWNIMVSGYLLSLP
jgi:hypothetical protein